MPVFLFTDIEGSTALWEKHRPVMLGILQRHDQILTEALDRYNGRLVKHTGDGIFAVFTESVTALECALSIQKVFGSADWGEIGELKIRIGLDGRPTERAGSDYFTDGKDYFGPLINQTARIMDSGWGGQIVFSPQVVELANLPSGAIVQDFGQQKFKGMAEGQLVYGLSHPELPHNDFSGLRSQPVQKSNLPVQPTPFIGRAKEQADLDRLLADPEIRLVTVVGPGGMGKTRLGLAMAERILVGASLRPPPTHGVYFVDLAPLGNFDDQLVSTLQHFIEMLQSGYSLLQAFAMVAERASEPTGSAFRQLVADLIDDSKLNPANHERGAEETQLHQIGGRLLGALDRLQSELNSNYFSRVVSVIQIQLTEGGNLSHRLDDLKTALQEDLGVHVWTDKFQYTTNLIVNAIAQAINFRFPQEKSSQKSQLWRFLSNKKMLLLLDNFEHLVNAAPLLSELLQNAPDVQLLVTSRERLHLREEQLYPIDGLEFPDWETPADAERYTAVQLFLQSARRNQPDFALEDREELTYLARICRLAAGMPLALELAASWVDMLPLAEIAEELQEGLDFLETESHNMPVRHRSIRAAIDYSWEKLTSEEQAVFARLSVFRGGFTRKVAKTVTGANLRQLAKLLNKSFLRGGQGKSARYQIHELLRQYGAERLATSGEETVIRRQHAAYFCDTLYQQWLQLNGKMHRIALIEIDKDAQNSRVAWQWSVSQNETQLVAKAMHGLGYYYEWYGQYEVGRQLIRDALRKMSEESSLLLWHGRFLQILGQATEAKREFQQALELLARVTHSTPEIHQEQARAHRYLGLGLLAQGQIKEAQSQLLKALELNQKASADLATAHVLVDLGIISYRVSDYPTAENYLQKGLTQYQLYEFDRGAAKALEFLGLVAQYQGKRKEANELLLKSAALYVDLKELPDIARGNSIRGLALMWAGEYDEAVEPTKYAVKIYDDLTDNDGGNKTRLRLATAYYYVGNMAEARMLLETGVAQGKFDATEQVYALFSLCLVELSDGNLSLAETIALECIQISKKMQIPSYSGRSEAILAIRYWMASNTDKAQRHAFSSLELGKRIPDSISARYGMIVSALILAEQGRLEWAITIDSLCAEVWLSYDHGRGVDSMLRAAFEPIKARLAPDIVTSAIARGKELDLWETAAAILQEITELGWGSSEDNGV